MSAQPGNLFGTAAPDADAQETREWIDALSAVIEAEGPERGHFLLEQLLEQARQHLQRVLQPAHEMLTAAGILKRALFTQEGRTWTVEYQR